MMKRKIHAIQEFVLTKENKMDYPEYLEKDEYIVGPAGSRQIFKYILENPKGIAKDSLYNPQAFKENISLIFEKDGDAYLYPETEQFLYIESVDRLKKTAYPEHRKKNALEIYWFNQSAGESEHFVYLDSTGNFAKLIDYIRFYNSVDKEIKENLLGRALNSGDVTEEYYEEAHGFFPITREQAIINSEDDYEHYLIGWGLIKNSFDLGNTDKKSIAKLGAQLSELLIDNGWTA